MKKFMALIGLAIVFGLFSLNSVNAQGWNDDTPNILWTNSNVGIGMDSPPIPLSVLGNIGTAHPNAPRFLFQRVAGDPILWNFEAGANVSQNGFAIADLTNGRQKLVIQSGTGDAFFPTGGLAVGTNAMPAGFTMAVNGKLIAEEIVVQLRTEWPDFVFSSDYELRSLREVEDYINTNGHLPDVPSASDVEKNNINLGEMSTILLQKVEELTLYVIELQKQNEKLQSQIESLK